MKFETMHLLLAIAFLLIAISFWRAHKKPDFDFNAFDLVMTNGKVDKISFAFMLVLGVTTWVIIDLQINGKLTEGYITTYGTLWVIPLVAKVLFNKGAPDDSTKSP